VELHTSEKAALDVVLSRKAAVRLIQGGFWQIPMPAPLDADWSPLLVFAAGSCRREGTKRA
jgi:hypothetical protein